ncbi:uncharacterized protein LOC113210112 [Frankliniella occidentalis]|uniref:Uncharacterized protein LOC113210112 n=1 Tax=Frankliniella occidentalis TaxID=133901 RepID=A0A6J1SR11_FRAOC|nr:uncharacterized protein LOC113210112 [Frankliniella occidentalis]
MSDVEDADQISDVDYFNVSSEQADEQNDSDCESTHSLDSAISDAGQGLDAELQFDSAKFLLNLREEAMVSQTALSKAVDGADELFSKFSNSIKDRIMQGIDASGAVSEEHIKNTFQEFSQGMFSGMDSKKSLDSFSEKHLGVLEPERVELYETQESDKNGVLKTVKHYAYTSPFVPSLKRLLSRPDVMSCVENSETSEEGVYRSYRDGKYCKEHPILSKKGTVAVICTFDELEVSSPLGPKKHKLALYYWTLANFNPQMRASLKSVQLMAIAWSKDLKAQKSLTESLSLDLKQERHAKIFAPFLDGIRQLEKGIKITDKKTVFGSLLCVTGDTPAVNVLGGFKESVSIAHKPCHKCLVDNEEMKSVFREDFFEKRTPENLKSHLNEVQSSQTLKERTEKSTRFGINGPSVISDLKHFDYVRCFNLDVMHIVHEGILEAHLRHLLFHAVEVLKVTKVEEINADVRYMANQLFSKDRPASILPSHLITGLRQSASQMLSLALCIPFHLKKTLDDLENLEEEERHDDMLDLEERLQNFVCLVQVTMGLLAFELTAEDLSKIRSMIQTHHETFIVHYPEFDVTPKFHFVIHIPEQIENFGPTRVTWTMRFEAQHSYFKNLIRIMKNFINPPLSCSYRYENLRASQMLTKPGDQPGNFIVKDDIYSFPRQIKTNQHQYKKLLSAVFDSEEMLLTCKSIRTKGAQFSLNSVVLLDDTPTFATVSDILCQGDIKILIVSVLKTFKYEPLCNAYCLEVLDSPEVRLCIVGNLAHFQPFNSMPFQGDNKKLWVIPKYHKIGFNHPLMI